MCNVPTPEALLQAGQQVSDNRLKIPPCGKLDLQLDSWWACHSGHQHSRPSTSRELEQRWPQQPISAAGPAFTFFSPLNHVKILLVFPLSR